LSLRWGWDPVHEWMPRGASCNRKVAFLCLHGVDDVVTLTCH
jgi:hypothetical protein